MAALFRDIKKNWNLSAITWQRTFGHFRPMIAPMPETVETQRDMHCA